MVEGSSDFFEALGDPAPDYDGSLFAVKNLGFIKFQIFDGGVVEVELHPRNVELPALLAVQQQIHSSRCKLFRIKHFDTEWHSEITSSAEHAISRLSEMCAPAASPPPTNKYMLEPYDFSRLFGDEKSPFRPMAQKWRAAFGYFDETVVPFAVKHQLLSRMIIVGVRPPTTDPVFRFIGDGFRWAGQGYLASGIGDKVQNQPDGEYGGWVSEYYRSVATSGQPRHDLITAVLHYEDEPGRPSRVTRYERVLLPWKTRSDEIFVSISSTILGEEFTSDVSPSPIANSRVMKLKRSS
ncbi:MAG TPA: hypothetical protein VM755_17630 [Stellaceae bacterium]|nr:hypothetical protein [Stellaceae bacterium]